MNKTFVIAGLAAILAGGAGAALAQAQGQAPAPAAPAAQADHQAGGPGMRGPGMRMRGMRGMRERPTLEQVQQRNTQMFSQMDANKDGRATFEEFRAFQEQRRLERQKQMFQRFSNGQDSITLAQMNARTQERFNKREQRRGGEERGR